MIFFSVSLLLLLSSTIVKSQSLSDELNSLPSCSDTCLESATTSLGCSTGDFSCYCSDSNGISARSSTVSNTTSCIQDACSTIDAKTSMKVVGQICVLLNENVSSSSTSSSKTTSSSASSTSTSSIQTTAALSTSMAPITSAQSQTATSSPTSTPALVASNNSSGGGLSGVAKAMIAVAIVAVLLIVAFGARFYLKRRSGSKRFPKWGKFSNLEDGTSEKAVELQGNDTQLFKLGGIGVRKSIRINAQRIGSLMSISSDSSDRHGSRRGGGEEPRGLLERIDERGLTPSPDGRPRPDYGHSRGLSEISYQSEVSVVSPQSEEMREPNFLFPMGHARSFSQSRTSLPPKLPALEFPSITISASSRPVTPSAPLPKSPPPPDVPVKTVARLDRPFSDCPQSLPSASGPMRSSVRLEPSPANNRHSVASIDRFSLPRQSLPVNRYSLNYPIPVTPNSLPQPFYDPLSPGVRSNHTFGGIPPSPASVSTFHTFPMSPQDITDFEIPPLPPMPANYPQSSTYISITHPQPFSPTFSPIFSPTTPQIQVYHTKQTSVSKIKPKMIYISNTPGIEVMPADSIFSTPQPVIKANTETDDGKGKLASPGNVQKPAIAIEPTIDRSGTLSSYGSQSSSRGGSTKLKPKIEQTLQEGAERERFQERQKQRKQARKDKAVTGQGSGDLGEQRVGSWYEDQAE
ncbi:CFEM domain-containing protein [Rutstroemia sp. NJR-2017a WRK4]|nr:CFEM domain-containing protein [Rutstroemia sp. NJR-2017a WRK4]